MSNTPLTFKELSAVFPIKSHDIASITGTLYCVSLDALNRDLRKNAASVPSMKGGVIYVHIAFTVTDADYLELPNTVSFVPAVSPGLLTYQPLVDTTAALRDNRRNIYKQDLFTFHKKNSNGSQNHHVFLT